MKRPTRGELLERLLGWHKFVVEKYLGGPTSFDLWEDLLRECWFLAASFGSLSSNGLLLPIKNTGIYLSINLFTEDDQPELTLIKERPLRSEYDGIEFCRFLTKGGTHGAVDRAFNSAEEIWASLRMIRQLLEGQGLIQGAIISSAPLPPIVVGEPAFFTPANRDWVDISLLFECEPHNQDIKFMLAEDGLIGKPLVESGFAIVKDGQIFLKEGFGITYRELKEKEDDKGRWSYKIKIRKDDETTPESERQQHWFH